MAEETIVRENLMTREGYSPYCPQCSEMPRTFFNGEQFQCPNCGWISQFPEDCPDPDLTAKEILPFSVHASIQRLPFSDLC